MRSRTERLAAGVLAAAVIVAAFRHEVGWSQLSANGTVTEQEGVPVSGSPVDLMTIASTENSRLVGRSRLILRDSAALAAKWTSLGTGTPPPDVAFQRALVAIVATGQRATGGHRISVDSASRVGDTLSVFVTTSEIARDCLVTQGFTQPAAAAMLDDTAPVVNFVEASRVNGC